MIYYLSLGSNIAPEANIALALQELTERYQFTAVLPIVRTLPCAMVSNNSFLNTIAIIASDESPTALKKWLNNLEEAHGRNRNDPLSSAKDRPLDIDILATQASFDFAVTEQFSEPYVQASLQALAVPAEFSAGNQRQPANAKKPPMQAAANPTVAVQLATAPVCLGHRAATIDFKHASGDIFVCEDSLDAFFQRCEATFNRQQCLA